MEVEHTNVRFLGNLVLNLWDCGGQYQYLESYYENDSIFINAEVLIYVFGEHYVLQLHYLSRLYSLIALWVCTSFLL